MIERFEEGHWYMYDAEQVPSELSSNWNSFMRELICRKPYKCIRINTNYGYNADFEGIVARQRSMLGVGWSWKDGFENWKEVFFVEETEKAIKDILYGV